MAEEEKNWKSSLSDTSFHLQKFQVSHCHRNLPSHCLGQSSVTFPRYLHTIYINSKYIFLKRREEHRNEKCQKQHLQPLGLNALCSPSTVLLKLQEPSWGRPAQCRTGMPPASHYQQGLTCGAGGEQHSWAGNLPRNR